MPEPTRSAIKGRVVHNLAIVSGYEETSIQEEHSLKNHLNMSVAARRSLAPGFVAIAKDHNEDAVISKAECENLKSVKGSIDLVWSRAKGAEG